MKKNRHAIAFDRVYCTEPLVWIVYAIDTFTRPERALRIAVSYDQLGNTVCNGDEDETISSRAGKAARLGKWWAVALCWVLNIFDKGHCERCIEPDRGAPVTTKKD